MPALLPSLKESDPAVLQEIAHAWGIDPGKFDERSLVDAVHAQMMDREVVGQFWDALPDDQRGALQTLLGSGARMNLPMFERIIGGFRKMGRGQIQREKPREAPISLAEALFYRGLVFEGFEQSALGAHPMIYIPTDLAQILPAHKTGFGNLEDLPPAIGEGGMALAEGVADIDEDLPSIDSRDPETLVDVQDADTKSVDDLTTLLAYFQVDGGVVETVNDGPVKRLAEADGEAIAPFLLRDDPVYHTFLFFLAWGGLLIDVHEGQIGPRRAEARRWLEATRAQQVSSMAKAWRESHRYQDLWHVPGLFPEPAPGVYDPVVARSQILTFIRDFIPQQDWWSIDELIGIVKEIEPDFQRPGGDYESWYIRNAEGSYLKGFESWDAVEGALLEFVITGPMHWLGLVDLAEDAARLTAYGRAFVNESAWPQGQEPEAKITVHEDGTLFASRRVARIDRFQAMRFTHWQPVEDETYVLKLTREGLRLAAEQGINTGHITAFLQRMVGQEDLPPTLIRLLERWQTGPTTRASLETLLVLRTTSEQILDRIWDDPAIRRYLGARLGPMAVAVRQEQWEALRGALDAEGIEVDVFE